MAQQMKAICLRQPWAELVASGRKTIETRTWATKYRGPLLIVASLGCKAEYAHLPRGVAVAVVELVDCRKMERDDNIAAGCEIYPRAKAWRLADVRRVAVPFKVKGRLNLFTVEVPNGTVR